MAIVARGSDKALATIGCLGIIALIVACSLLVNLAVWAGWNNVVVPVFGVPRTGFWHIWFLRGLMQ